MIRIVIVDDHNLFREGLAAILRQEADVQVAGLAGNVEEAVAMVLRLRPEIVLMDFGLPDGNGAEATRRILQEFPACKVVFMSMSDRDEDLLAAVRSGAVGYLMKNIAPSKLMASLHAVMAGESALSRTMTLRVMGELSRTKESARSADPALGKLTGREKEVLAQLAAGKSNPEIARTLVIAENTVKYHVHSILEKLNLPDRKEAAQFARLHGVK